MSDSTLKKVKQAAVHELSKFSEELARERDELKLQLHLLSAEAKEEWEDIETNFKHFSRKASEFGNSVENISDEGIEALKKLGRDLKEAFKNKRNQI